MISQLSRLDRQVLLIETGSTQVVRNVAASQLGDLAKQHPEDILSLLSRVYPYLLNKKWDTRVTAAKAVGSIVSHANIWDPNENDQNIGIFSKENSKETAKIKLEDTIRLKLEELNNNEEWKLLHDDSYLLSLENFDLNMLFKSSKTLLATGRHDYPSGEPQLKKHQYHSTIDIKDDLDINVPKELENSHDAKKSARMLAMAKRKKKIQAKTTTKKPVDLSQSSISRNLMNQEQPDCKSRSPTLSPTQSMNPKLEVIEQSDENKIMIESMVSPLLETHEKTEGLVWQFQGIYELLLKNLIDDSWEIRHGAALGLRELIKKHAKSVARIAGESRDENDRRNYRALSDLATRLLTIFALDRFCDFVNDTVVAPVRESAAQTLSALLIHLDDSLSLKIFNCLELLVLQDPIVTGIPNKIWEATHGGLLGIRYFVSIKTDFLFHHNLLNNVVKVVLYGLNEHDDDVQSVAAAILTPITNEFVKLDQVIIDRVISTIWNSLSNLNDDLSSSVSSVMDLLTKLCQHQEALDVLNKKATNQPTEWSFKSLVPKLYPFLRHSITNVRKAVLNLLLAFLSIKDDSTKFWITGKMFRLLFQNIILEQNSEVLDLSFKVYSSMLKEYNSKYFERSLDHILGKHLAPILHLLITPIGERGKNYSMELQYILKPSPNYQLYGELKRAPSPSTLSDKAGAISSVDNERINIDTPMIAGDTTLLGPEIIVNSRVLGANALGLTLSMFQESTLKSFFQNVLVGCFKLPYSTPRMLISIVISELCLNWPIFHQNESHLPIIISETFNTMFTECLIEPNKLPVFRELVPSLKALRTQCQSLMSTFVDVGMVSVHRIPQIAIIVKGEAEAGPEAFSIELAEKVYGEYYEKLFKSLSSACKVMAKKPLDDSRYRIKQAIDTAKDSNKSRVCNVLASYAYATLLFNGLPKKLNPFIRSLMDSIKEERYEILQRRSGDSIIHLIDELIKNNKQNVSNKIIKNLCGFLCVDTLEVPEFLPNMVYKDSILTLTKEAKNLDIQDNLDVRKLAEEARIKRRGSVYTLNKLFEKYGTSTLETCAQLKNTVFDPLEKAEHLDLTSGSNIDIKLGQDIVDSLGVARIIFEFMDPKLKIQEVSKCLPHLLKFLRSDFSVFRYSSARTLAELARILPIHTMPFVIKNILPLLNNASSVVDRQGVIEFIYHLSSSMGSDILPYVVFLIIPLLGRMSDSNQDIRNLATTTFASIIKLVPLEGGVSDPDGLPKYLMESREKERDFIEQMMDPSKAKPFKLPVSIKATLRKYQQDGVNWLAFLNKYHLHGILCDDMGLGKTLQTICIVASYQYLRQEEYNVSKSKDLRPLSSLIICPPSLTGHWEQEFEQYAPFLNVLVYAGGPSSRYPLRNILGTADIVITSYDVARNDIEIINNYDYNYCVLDEGHIIKNAQSKLAKAVKLIRANHRLILTGTPIQNNVVELWSLFDFLMPGFMGSEKVFQERFAKPIAASRNNKISSKEQEAGALALEALHKQVLPFMLRRLKEDVLSDLPPKIIQDYYCELSDLQKQLYKDFAKKQKNVVEKEIENTQEIDNKQHIFQALQYMRKLCNHPSLVLNKNHPQYDQVQNYLNETNISLHDIAHAPKLGALRNLLFECGIGTQCLNKKNPQFPSVDGVISQHRALIFCQLKDMLDMVENDLFKKYMPSVTYMRLDGTVDSRDRQKVVRRFNEDPSIDCLLLTTKVGGLGLNLTGADTVIFVEHDWNPMNDLQAMDRAHRLGQKKVVNVYRIITKGTLEEKIMGLQKFKMNIASTVVNQQNSGLSSMDTHQLLDLFDTNNVPSQDKIDKKSVISDEITNETGLTGKAKMAVGELQELWDSSQYEEEYNLDNFIKTLR